MGMKTRDKKLFYSHLFAMIAHHALTYYSVRACIKTFGNFGAIVASDKLQQVQTKNTLIPVNAKILYREQKKELRSGI